MKKIVLTILCLLMLAPATFADVKPSKEQKEICKQLKKQLNARYVEVFDNAPEAPYYHFATKDSNHGIVNAQGQIILQPKYQDVVYFPEFNGAMLHLEVSDDNGNPTGKTMDIPTKPTPEAFWGLGQKNTEVYSSSGVKIAQIDKNRGTYFGNYFYIASAPYTQCYEQKPRYSAYDLKDVLNVLTLYQKQGYGHGSLLWADGTCAVDTIDDGTIVSGNNYIEYSVVDENGTILRGMTRLDGEGYNIPPKFHYLNYDKKRDHWLVTEKATDNISKVYDPSVEYNTKFRDRGEALYNKCVWPADYDAVLEYYANEGIEAPWAKFFTAMSLSHRDIYTNTLLESYVDQMEKGSGLPSNEGNLINRVNLRTESLKTAKALFEEYLASGDDSFAQEAKNNLDMTNYWLNQMDEYSRRYNKARGNAAAVTAQAEAAQEARLRAIIGIFNSALQAATRSSSKSTSTSGSYSASAVSGASSGAAPEKQDNTNRKIFLKNQIADWKQRVKKMEEEYEREMGSGDDHDWKKKKVLETKQKNIEEALEMIRKYEAELNALK